MLNELVRYARANLADSEPGFTTRTVRWLVELSDNGCLINVLPLGDSKGEQTSKCPDMHKINARGRAHFLVETLQTVTLISKPNEERKKIAGALEKQRFFTDLVLQAADSSTILKPLAMFMKDTQQLGLLKERLLKEKAKPTDWLRWTIAGTDPLRHDDVLDWWRKWRMTDQMKGKAEEKNKTVKTTQQLVSKSPQTGMVCFLTGEILEPVATQPKITGLSGVGGKGTRDVLAGFDKAAFCSFGLEQAKNAAMGEKPAREYVDALNYLIKNHSRKLANALVVHWFKETLRPEDDPLAFLFEPPEIVETAAQNSVRQLLASLRTGQRVTLENNHFYAMTVSGASGRVMVRDWMEGPFKELVDKIEKWFADLEIVARDGGRLAPDPKFMAVCGCIMRELKDLPAPTATILWRVALAGLPIPQSIIAKALARFRTDLINDEPFNHARMGLIKAYFIRKGGNQYMSAYLNKEHPEPAYQCGRLLAILAGLQRAALGDIGAGVVQRYYVAASQTPGLTLGRLFNNAKNHLNKLEGGLAYWYENQIAEIMSRIQDHIPSTLNLDQQSLFALGYYQQIAANRVSKNNINENTKGDKQ